MKPKLLALMLLAGSSALAGSHFYFGVGIGGYPVAPPPVVAYQYQAPCPDPGYSWVAGYYYPVGRRWAWRRGYWAHRPHARGRWVAPRYHGHRHYRGYWRR